MSMVLVVELDVNNTKTSLATSVQGLTLLDMYNFFKCFFQTTTPVSCGTWQDLNTVFCNEDGTCPSRSPQRHRQSQLWGSCIP